MHANPQVPEAIEAAFDRGLLVGVVQFGSSLYAAEPNDIDLAVVTRAGAFDEALAALRSERLSPRFDISLIQEEEVAAEPFRFGSHGPHLVLSLKEGRALLGTNPFAALRDPSPDEVLASVRDRLGDYIYAVRKSYFSPNASDTEGIRRRYGKIIRLATLFLCRGRSFPAVLRQSAAEAEAALAAVGIPFVGDQRATIETLWAHLSADRQRS